METETIPNPPASSCRRILFLLWLPVSPSLLGLGFVQVKILGALACSGYYLQLLACSIRQASILTSVVLRDGFLRFNLGHASAVIFHTKETGGSKNFRVHLPGPCLRAPDAVLHFAANRSNAWRGPAQRHQSTGMNSHGTQHPFGMMRWMLRIVRDICAER